VTKLQIINHNAIDSAIIGKKVLYKFNTKQYSATTDRPYFKLSGWIIDKEQQTINIVVVAQGIKFFHELNASNRSIITRMGGKLGLAANERYHFSFRIETIEDFDLYLEIDNRLIPWKHGKIVTTTPAIQNKEAALAKFKEANFSSAQSISGNEATAEQKQLDNSIPLAMEGLFYFFSNQYHEISARHLNAVNILYNTIAPNINMFWRETKKMTFVEALNEPVFQALEGNLTLLIEECRNENFAVSLVENITDNSLSLASPFSTGRATCRESYEADSGFTCLRFIDGQHCFFLMQGLTSADGIYFPSENILISFAVVNETHVQNLKKKLIRDFVKTISYAKAENSFFGIIASHSRPYHFYYDIWPVLVELSEKPNAVAKLPHIVMRLDHDFNNADLLFDGSKCVVLDSASINALALNEHKWFIHIGTRFSLRNRLFYDRVDQALVDNAVNSPSQTALEKISLLQGCYPIVWIGIEGQKRCWLEQVEGYAYILSQLHKKHPQLGVVFDGWTLPITPSPASANEVEKDRQVVNKIAEKISTKIKFVSTVGDTSLTKLAVGNNVDFFISNFATGSMHVSRILGKPGFGHLSKRFSEVSLRLAMHTHPNNNVYLLPQQYVTDEDRDIMHDWISYSINKKDFYRFIESKLEKVLNTGTAPRVKIFIEPPYTVNWELRQYLKLATYGNLIQIFPGKRLPNKVEDLANYSKAYLNKQVVYDTFSYGSHKKIIGTAHYLIWLRDPLERVYFHVTKLAKMAAAGKGHDVSVLDIFSRGHKTVDNYLTRMISDIDAPFGKCTEAMLERAIDNLNKDFIFIGLDERQSESFDLLCATMDWDRSLFPNEIPHKFEADHHDFAEDIQHTAEAMVNYDLRLYQAAEAIFNDKLKQLKNESTAIHSSSYGFR